MEKYEKVKKSQDRPEDNEVRIGNNSRVGAQVKYIISQFNDKDAKEVILRTVGGAITKIITIAEVVKHRVKGIHQLNDIGTQVFEDIYEPLEEGLDRLVFTRKVTSFTVTLSKVALDTAHYGYQEPIPEEEVEENFNVSEHREHREHRERRGGYGGDRRGGDRRGGYRGGFRGGRGGSRGGYN